MLRLSQVPTRPVLAEEPWAWATSAIPCFGRIMPPRHAARVAGEASRILLAGFRNGGVSDADKAYLTQLVATNTGVDQPTAAKRVGNAIAQLQKTEADLKKAADGARKAAAATAFAIAFSMLIGAFIGGAAGALGGRHREEHPVRAAL